MISAGCSIASLRDFCRMLYRQVAAAFESQKRKEVQEVSRRGIFWNVRWHSYGYDPTRGFSEKQKVTLGVVEQRLKELLIDKVVDHLSDAEI
jgi:hypothetical protein